ncbi:MAG: restriction endonuclease subunit S, partial [Actinomycetota bacterium]|nr:restriction endonuclease subunit S [Actinomycetota bacterium]
NYWNGRAFKKSEWRPEGQGRQIIRIQDLTGSHQSPNYFDGMADERNIARKGDILVSWAATLGVFEWPGPEAVVNQHIFKVESFIDRRFHRYLIDSVLDDLRRRSHGTGMVHVTRNVFDETPVLLPPLAEQERIVAAIEEQGSRLDQAELLLDQAEHKVVLMRQAILFDAVTGDWPVKSLADVAEVRLGRQRSPKNHHGEHMKPYLRAANVTWAGLKLNDVKQMNFLPDEAVTFRLANGDVLVSEASGSPGEVGKPAIWRGEISDCCFQNTLVRVRPLGALPEWLHLVLYNAARSGRLGEAAPGVGIHHIGAARLAAWPIPVPPIDEQHRLVAEVERELALLESLTTAINHAVTRSGHLRRSILERAFSGQLVPQYSGDEPAFELLARIASDHRKTAKPRRRQRA